MVAASSKILQAIQPEFPNSLANSILRGIEKEALRITPEGYISQAKHPLALGSKLTHPTITTDYSEALLEFITPPFNTIDAVLSSLDALQAYTYAVIGDELLWAASMPCYFTNEADIPIADYGSSPIGQMKTIYRYGLSHRYGSKMQTIAGLHYNISYPQWFWQALQHYQQDSRPLQEFINDRGMGLVRNFLRLSFGVFYFFGASPAICRAFDPKNRLGLSALGEQSWAGSHATSLRMSDVGYQNAAQAQLNISFNSLEQYATDLIAATAITHPNYTKIPCTAGNWQQLSASLLQIEAEYYASIRPKQITATAERPAKALRARGIAYFEIRALDLNPYARGGISKQQSLWLDCLLLHCVLSDSPEFTAAELALLKENQQKTVLHGRQPGLKLHLNGNKAAASKAQAGQTIEQALHQVTEDLLQIADLLDQELAEPCYREAVLAISAGIDDKAQLPSSRILEAIQHDFNNNYYDFARHYSKLHQQYYQEHHLSEAELMQQQLIAQQSLTQQQELEADTSTTLEQAIAEYFS